jgi:hypothetical protein
VVALGDVAAEVGEGVEGLGGLHAFGHDMQAEVVSQFHHGPDNTRSAYCVAISVTNERSNLSYGSW